MQPALANNSFAYCLNHQVELSRLYAPKYYSALKYFTSSESHMSSELEWAKIRISGCATNSVSGFRRRHTCYNKWESDFKNELDNSLGAEIGDILIGVYASCSM